MLFGLDENKQVRFLFVVNGSPANGLSRWRYYTESGFMGNLKLLFESWIIVMFVSSFLLIESISGLKLSMGSRIKYRDEDDRLVERIEYTFNTWEEQTTEFKRGLRVIL